MKYAIALLLSLCLLSTACTPNQVFVRAVRQHTEVILPEYKAYVLEDSDLSDQSKAIRVEGANELSALIEEASNAE
jgi:hypothetical protein